MSEREKRLAKSLADAVKLLPEGEKQRLLGYAEGVAAMAAKKEGERNADDATDDNV